MLCIFNPQVLNSGQEEGPHPETLELSCQSKIDNTGLDGQMIMVGLKRFIMFITNS